MEETPARLMYRAIQANDCDQVDALLASGFNIEDSVSAGYTPLQMAVQVGQTEIVELLLDRGADVNCSNGKGKPLCLAITSQQTETARVLIAHGADVNAGSDDKPPLSAAIANGQIDIVKMLLDAGAQVNGRDAENMTSLHHALFEQYEHADEIACLLIAHGADINATDRVGRVPLAYAAQRGHARAVTLLLENGADPNCRAHPLSPSNLEPFASALQCAARNGHVEVVKELLSHGASPNEAGGRFNRTPLHEAGGDDAAEIASLLLAAGAEVNATDDLGRTPLHAYLEQGLGQGVIVIPLTVGTKLKDEIAAHLNQGFRQDVVSLLIAHGADVNAADENGMTALYMASPVDQTDPNNAQAAKMLIAAGADVNVKTKTGETPLLRAAAFGSTDLVTLLLDKGADANLGDNKGHTPFSVAVSRGHPTIALVLVARGAHVAGQSLQSGRTLLHCAASTANGSRELIELLIAGGFDGNARTETPTLTGTGTSDEWTPLHLAASAGCCETTEALIAHGADVNATSKAGATALHEAVHGAGTMVSNHQLGNVFEALTAGEIDVNVPSHIRRFADIAEMLIVAGADVDAADDAGQTPLHWAAGRGRPEMVRVLLDAGADVNARDNNQTTPLLAAAGNGRYPPRNREYTAVVDLLLTHGANPDVQDSKGQTASHLAAIRGSQETIELLLAHGADANLKDSYNTTASSAAAYAKRDDIVKLLEAAEAKGKR